MGTLEEKLAEQEELAKQKDINEINRRILKSYLLGKLNSYSIEEATKLIDEELSSILNYLSLEL
ncbi:MAG: hypothetical protein LBC61_06020 [Candidatus Peribacteria bacterium]|jgi:hypothetical protein|nr:hypothetical protein [Candidatus Peribacteria bacterium]